MTWVSILGNISIWIILVPLFIGMIRYRKLNDDSKIILMVVFVGTIPQVLKPFINGSSTLNVLYNLYTPVEFVCYYLLFKRRAISVLNKKVIASSFYLFLIISFLFIYKYGLKDRFINELVVVNNAIQLVWICFCLLEFYKNESSSFEISHPFFWFLFGITLYSSCTVVVYSIWLFVESNRSIHRDLIKLIHPFFNTLVYIFFSIGLWKSHNRVSYFKRLIEFV